MSPKSESTVPSSVITPLVYTIFEAAVALTVCPRTIRNLIRSGQLVHRKIGARTVIPRTSLESFLRRDHKTRTEGVPQKTKSGRAKAASVEEKQLR
jgi:excisionase family DNA binding protein